MNKRYKILETIGKGGMGIVYKANDNVLNRMVAIKHLNPDLLDSSTNDRFLREAQEVAKFSHPNIVAIHDFGHEGDSPYIVMELVIGSTLARRMPISLENAVEIAYQICLALNHAHERGVIHRDVKPENVLLSATDGLAKLVDFGIAHVESSKLTVDGDIIGTLSYMAPEQIVGGPVDQRTDLYSLGVMLYELTTQNHPFKGSNPLEIINNQLHAELPAPIDLNKAIPPALNKLILELLEKEPDHRPGSSTMVLEILKDLLDFDPDSDFTPLPLRRTSEYNRPSSQANRSLFELKPEDAEILDSTHLSLIHSYPDEITFNAQDLKLLYRSSLAVGIDLDTWSRRAQTKDAAFIALKGLLGENPEPKIRAKLVENLANFDGEEVTQTLFDLACKDENHVVRSLAAVSSAKRGRFDEIVEKLQNEIAVSNDPVAMAAYVAIADEVKTPRVRLGFQNLYFLLLLGQRRWRSEKEKIFRHAWRGARAAGLLAFVAGAFRPLLIGLLVPGDYQSGAELLGISTWLILASLVTAVFGFSQGFMSTLLIGISDMISASRSGRYTLGAISGLVYSGYLIILTMLQRFPEGKIAGGEAYVIYLLYGLVMGGLLTPVISHYDKKSAPATSVPVIITSAALLLTLTLITTHLIFQGTNLYEYIYRSLYVVAIVCGLGFFLNKPAKHDQPTSGG